MSALLIALCLVTAIAALAPTAAELIERVREQRMRSAARSGFPTLIDALAAAVRGGLSLPLAFSELAPTVPPPLASGSFRVAADLWLGSPSAAALGAYERVIAPEDIAPLALVLSSFERTGGRVAPVLERVAALLRGRIALADERRALTAQSRSSAIVLVSLAPLGLVFLTFAMPDYLVTLANVGLGLAGLAVALEVIGALWLWRIVRATSSIDDLASFLDAVVVGLDAGLTFERALSGLVDRVPRLARREDARRLLADLRLGEGLGPSLRRFARGPGEMQVAALVSSSVRFGAPLAQLLVLHANAMRESQRHDAEARARRLPVLMLFPLSLCILPALLIVFLGPPLLSLLR